jgi:hypothetical protein
VELIQALSRFSCSKPTSRRHAKPNSSKRTQSTIHVVHVLMKHKYRTGWSVPKTWYYIGEDRPYKEIVTHHRWSEIIIRRWNPFRLDQGLATLDLLLDTMFNQRTWEARPIDWTKALSNIYEKGSQICCLRGKTYKDVDLGELAHPFAVGHASEHEAICGNEPAEE